jgi:hypothetical protein
MDANRALLDELMGLDRNLVTEEKSKVRGRHFSDENICKLFIQGFCPHDLFTNTKSDLGLCKKLHDEACKREWASCEDKSRYSYPSDMLKHLERLINDMDIKMERQQAKLNEENTAELSGHAQSKVASLTAECDVLLKKIEDLGEQGLVTEATSAMEVLTRLQAEKEALLKSSQPTTLPGGMPIKQMKVCEICGSLLVVGDSLDRVQAHLEGKQHKGYQLIRETIAELKKTVIVRGGDRNDRSDRDRPRDDRNHRNDRDRPRDDRDRRDNRGDIRDNRDNRDRDRGRDDRYRDDRRDNRYRNDRGRDNHDRRDYRRDDRDARPRDDNRYTRDRGEDKYRERDEDRSSSKRKSVSPESDRNEKRRHT